MENVSEAKVTEYEEEFIQVELTDTIESEDANDTADHTVKAGTSSEKTVGQATFEGNAHDLSALFALICGVIVFLICASCGLGLYLLPVAAIVLGVVGLLMAKDAVNPQRAQLWSWLGLGAGIITVLLALIGIAVYILLIFGSVKGLGY